MIGAALASAHQPPTARTRSLQEIVMRRTPLLFLLLLALGACRDTAGPTIFSTAGAWRSQGFAPASVEVTLVETARSTTGAGRWLTDTEANAFLVTGAHSDSTVSLYFDFHGSRPDLTFEGRFRKNAGDGDETLMVGNLYGGEFRGEAFTFEPDEAAGQ
jgi:hypothetical protein